MSVLNTRSVQPFLEYLKYEKRYSVHTFSSYRDDLTDFIHFLDKGYGGVALKDINHHLVRSWLAGLKDRGLSSKSINRKISSLRSFFKYCLKTGVIDTTPMARVISLKLGKRLPSFVTEEDVNRLIDALNQSADDWKSLNAKMIISILYATGMRLSELLNLREKQVDFGRSQIKVLGKGNKERIIPVSKQLLELILNYQQEKAKGVIFKDTIGRSSRTAVEKTGEVLLVSEKGKKLYPKYAWILVNTYLGQASSLDKKSPHVLRHTFATHLMNNGASLNAVKELLGHSSLAATQVYTHNSIGKLKNIHKNAHPRA